ncbi:MAG: hypothetical protein ABI358_02020 [Ginsengibacter sp.]
MKTVINSNENSILEFAKRGIYNFQVLILGVFISFLFLFGISNGNQKKTNDKPVKQENEIIKATQLSNDVMGFIMPRI